MNQEELNSKFKIFEQQIMQIQEQLRVLEQAIFDMTSISSGLNELVDKKGEEVMAPIGRGIFIKAKLLEEDLLVDVGMNNFVKKTIPETKDIIESQLKKIKISKKDLESQLEVINKEITETMMEFQSKK